MLTIFLVVLALIWIIFAVVSDLKTREIPNWLNFSLIIFILGIRFFYSFFDENWDFFIQGLFGFGIFFIISNFLYYARFFAGGDAKLMMSLGPVLPLEVDFLGNVSLFLNFLFLFLIAGAIFGFVSILYFSYKDFNKIKKDFIKNMKNNKRIFYLFMLIGLLLMLTGFFGELLFLLGALLFILPYLFFYTKAIDNVCLVQKINSKELTEGDWLHQQVKIGSNTIIPKWEGVNKKEIRLIRKKYKFVLIKRGIEFSPVFLVSFIVFVSLYFSGINLWNSLW